MHETSISTELSHSIALFGQSYPLNAGLVGTFGYHEFGDPDEGVIRDYATRIVKLLVEQYELSSGMRESIQAFADEVQQLEDAGQDVLFNRSLSNAVGVQLDGIGEIVGETRQGRTDDEYRAGIRFRIFINKSSGEIETLGLFVIYLTGGTFAQIIEHYPAKVEIIFNAITIPANMHQLVNDVAAGGVGILLTWQTSGGFAFGFDGEGSMPAQTDVRGFDELTVVIESGKFTETIS